MAKDFHPCGHAGAVVALTWLTSGRDLLVFFAAGNKDSLVFFSSFFFVGEGEGGRSTLYQKLEMLVIVEVCFVKV